MKKDKEYVGVMRLHQEVSEEKLKEEVKNFIGKIMQKPPVKSRVKREEREREVYSFDILEIEGKNVLFKTKVEAGTYIRKLVHDLGLKIVGAHMAELRRTQAGIFSENDENFVNLYELEKAVEEFKSGDEESLRKILIPGEVISKILPVIQVLQNQVKQLLTGKPIFKEDVAGEFKVREGESVAVFCGDRFIEVARIIDDKDIFAKPEFVLN